MLATLVNFYNPSLIIIGGGVAEAGDLLLAAIRQVVYRKSLPLATRNLPIVLSEEALDGERHEGPPIARRHDAGDERRPCHGISA